jgi:hypothetical protein
MTKKRTIDQRQFAVIIVKTPMLPGSGGLPVRTLDGDEGELSSWAGPREKGGKGEWEKGRDALTVGGDSVIFRRLVRGNRIGEVFVS